MNEQESYEGWTLVEQLGHKRLAGYVRSVEIAGAGMLRVDVPTEPPLTQYLNPTSIYALTPITEEVARFLAPKYRYDLPQVAAPVEIVGEVGYVDDERDDDDDEY